MSKDTENEGLSQIGQKDIEEWFNADDLKDYEVYLNDESSDVPHDVRENDEPKPDNPEKVDTISQEQAYDSIRNEIGLDRTEINARQQETNLQDKRRDDFNPVPISVLAEHAKSLPPRKQMLGPVRIPAMGSATCTTPLDSSSPSQ